MSSGGHSTSMGISLKFNRDQLKRRDKQYPIHSGNQNIAKSRQPIKSNLTDKEKLIIAKRQKLIALKKRRSNRITFLIITAFTSAILLYIGIGLLKGLDKAMDHPHEEVMTYGQRPGSSGFIDLDPSSRDYSPIEPEPLNRFN
jgi:hypothetical protein